MENNSQVPKLKKRKRNKKKKTAGVNKTIDKNIPGVPQVYNRISIQEYVAVSKGMTLSNDPGTSEIWRLANSQPWELPRETIAKSQGQQDIAHISNLQREENPNQAGPSGVPNGCRKRIHSPSKTDKQPNNVLKTSSETDAIFCTLLGSDRPSRVGLRNQTHPIEPVYNICASSVEDSRSLSPKTPPYSAPNSNNEVIASTSYAGFRNDKMDVVIISDCESDDSVHYVPMVKRKEEVVELDDDVDDPIYVGIRNDTPMSQIQMILVNRAMNNVIIGIGVKGAGPRFVNNSHKAGWILITCEDHESRRWLEREVPKLQPWPGARLSIIPYKELQTPVMTTLLVPKKEGVNIHQALELLRVQNERLETKYWKIVDGCKLRTGHLIMLSIDKQSYDDLKLMNFRANLGASKVLFKFGTGIKNLSMSAGSDAGYCS